MGAAAESARASCVATATAARAAPSRGPGPTPRRAAAGGGGCVGGARFKARARAGGVGGESAPRDEGGESGPDRARPCSRRTTCLCSWPARPALGPASCWRMRADSDARRLGSQCAWTRTRVHSGPSPRRLALVGHPSPARCAVTCRGQRTGPGQLAPRSGQAPGSSRVSQSGARRSESVRHRDGGRLGYGGAAGAAGAGPSFPPRARLSAQKARKVCSARLHRGN